MALLLLAVIGGPATAQTWDTSGNKLLNGTYYFREVFYLPRRPVKGTSAEAVALYGQITFEGNGTYTLSCHRLRYRATSLTVACRLADWCTMVGRRVEAAPTRCSAASGYGFLSNPAVYFRYIYGLVSQQGIFVGSCTESRFNDFFVAAPLSSRRDLATFKGSYSIADMDLSKRQPAYSIGAMFQLNPDGAGNLGTVS